MSEETDSVLSNLEVLFKVPEQVKDKDLQDAVGKLASTLSHDLEEVSAPVEVVMEASAALNQFAKHMHASRQPYGYPELGGYNDPGSERASLSSLHGGLTALREAMAKLRVVRVNPEALKEAIAERDQKFARAAQEFFESCRDQEEPLAGSDLMFFAQERLFALLQAEGLVE